jgi:hypothetical protein
MNPSEKKQSGCGKTWIASHSPLAHLSWVGYGIPGNLFCFSIVSRGFLWVFYPSGLFSTQAAQTASVFESLGSLPTLPKPNGNIELARNSH